MRFSISRIAVTVATSVKWHFLQAIDRGIFSSLGILNLQDWLLGIATLETIRQ